MTRPFDLTTDEAEVLVGMINDNHYWDDAEKELTLRLLEARLIGAFGLNIEVAYIPDSVEGEDNDRWSRRA